MSAIGSIICKNCKGNRFINEIGGIVNECNNCLDKKIIHSANKVHLLLLAFVRKNCLIFSFLTFLIMCNIAVHHPNPANIAGAISLLGIIFVALKFKLDQATYQKDFFKERFKIFKKIDIILWEWASKGEANREMVAELNKLMRKSYYLFPGQTYQFIKKFRYSIIVLAYKLPQTSENEEILKARGFLTSLVDLENLPKKFPELIIDSY